MLRWLLSHGSLALGHLVRGHQTAANGTMSVLRAIDGRTVRSAAVQGWPVPAPRSCFFHGGRKSSGGGGPCSPRGSLPYEFTVETGHRVPVNGTGHMVGCGTAVMVKTRGQPPTPLRGTGVISLRVCVSKANACVDTKTTAPLRTMRSGEAAGRRRGVCVTRLCTSSCVCEEAGSALPTLC